MGTRCPVPGMCVLWWGKVGCEQSVPSEGIWCAQCWGCGLLERCSVSVRVPALPHSLAAEETSPKETELFFLPPSLSFCCLWAAEWVCIDQETKEPFRPRLWPQPARSGLLLMRSVPPFSPGSLTLIVNAAPEQH